VIYNIDNNIIMCNVYATVIMLKALR